MYPSGARTADSLLADYRSGPGAACTMRLHALLRLFGECALAAHATLTELPCRKHSSNSSGHPLVKEVVARLAFLRPRRMILACQTSPGDLAPIRYARGKLQHAPRRLCVSQQRPKLAIAGKMSLSVSWGAAAKTCLWNAQVRP
jgi:hypothetical protein